jgi:DNA-binding response OmpR family regulator
MRPCRTGSETAERGGVALVVTSLDEDHAFLGSLFTKCSWQLDSVSTVRDSIQYLQRHLPGLLICDERLEDGDWKAILDLLTKVEGPPRMIVTSRRADERLWAEVLNLGGYDVLAKPFDASEVVRVVCTAWPRCGKRNGR